MEDYITISELKREDFEDILKIASELKEKYKNGKKHRLLEDKTLFMIFYNSSLRTRNSFEAGMTQLGGHAIFLEPKTIYTPSFKSGAKTERISDTAQVLSRMGNAISIRIFGEPTGWNYGTGNKIVREFARWSNIPVINMECDMFHPCQAAADMLTIKERFKDFKGKKLAICWSPNSSVWKPTGVPQSLSIAATLMGMDVVLASPKGLEIDPKIIDIAKYNIGKNGGSLKITNNYKEAYKDADIVYAKSWTSLKFLPPKTKKPQLSKIRALFKKNKNWTCDKKKMKLAKEKAIYMHSLPAEIGAEVTQDVIDGKQSVVFDQAENRMHTQKAILVKLLK